MSQPERRLNVQTLKHLNDPPAVFPTLHERIITFRFEELPREEPSHEFGMMGHDLLSVDGTERVVRLQKFLPWASELNRTPVSRSPSKASESSHRVSSWPFEPHSGDLSSEWPRSFSSATFRRAIPSGLGAQLDAGIDDRQVVFQLRPLEFRSHSILRQPFSNRLHDCGDIFCIQHTLRRKSHTGRAARESCPGVVLVIAFGRSFSSLMRRTIDSFLAGSDSFCTSSCCGG